MLNKRSRKFRIAQTTTELAIFGTILIFIMGIILRQSLGFSFAQNMNLKATRWAMKTSYEHSSGLVSADPVDGDASRNSASILIIEDRLTASNAKYGSIDRTPQIASGSGTHSRNLLMPVEDGEHYNMPVFDVYVNGKYFAFKVAALKQVNFNSGHPDYDTGCSCVPGVFRKVFNVAGEGYNAGAADIPAFDLNRNGVLDPEEPPAGAFRVDFSWQWQQVGLNSIQEGELYDVDGDLKTERVVRVPDPPVTWVRVQDSQDGDLDLSQNTYDLEVLDIPRFGLQQSAEVFTFTETPNDPSAPGTFLRIEEGRLIDAANQLVRSVNRKDQIDMISRHIRLANNTGIWCSGGVPRDFSTMSAGQTNGMSVNPVEACGSCLTSNFDATCFGTDSEGYPSIWVRSRIIDRRGRKWITNITADDAIDFDTPPVP